MAAAASHQQQHRHPKRRRLALSLSPYPTPAAAPPLDSLLFLILDRVAEADPRALKSFALASRACHAAESRHRRVVRPLRADLLPAALARYRSATRLDLSLCARVPDAAIASAVSGSSPSCSASALCAVDLSRSRGFGFGAAGVAALAASCPGLADLDLSNGVDLGDATAVEVARAKGLRSPEALACALEAAHRHGARGVAVGCAELRELSLKWCLGVSDLGVQLLALKCRKLVSLDLSYTMVLDMSQCQNITDVGVSSILKSVPNLLELDLSFCCPFTPSVVRSFLNSGP